MKDKRTRRRVEITNGTRHTVRWVYVNVFGIEYVKLDGKRYTIRADDNGGYNSVWFSRVSVING